MIEDELRQMLFTASYDDGFPAKEFVIWYQSKLQECTTETQIKDLLLDIDKEWDSLPGLPIDGFKQILSLIHTPENIKAINNLTNWKIKKPPYKHPNQYTKCHRCEHYRCVPCYGDYCKRHERKTTSNGYCPDYKKNVKH